MRRGVVITWVLPCVVVPDLRGVLAAVAAGAGVTVLPRYLCEDDLASGALVPLVTPEDPPINTGFLVERAGALPALRSPPYENASSGPPAPGSASTPPLHTRAGTPPQTTAPTGPDRWAQPGRET